MKPKFNAPLYIAWEVTLQCNARCLHCYSNSGPGVQHPQQLSTNEALRIIDQLAEAGLLILAFSGGEPLIRRDIFGLIKRAVENALVVNLASNGALIDEKMAVRLKEAGVRSITISLDGARAETHDDFRRFPGLFDRTIRAIQTLVKNDHRVVVSFTPTIRNYQEGPDVVALAHSLGANAVNMSEYVPAGRGTRKLALPADTLREVVHQWIEMRREYADRMRIIWHDCRVALLVPEEEQDRYSGCGAGKLTARICVDGTLTPCVFLSNSAGNLRSSSFRDIWDNSPLLRMIRNRDELRWGNCGGCRFKHICGGCRAASMANYGDPMMGDPYCWVVRQEPNHAETGGCENSTPTPAEDMVC
jgi:radical SAM protein with 4Fe4S-binding SPASM domain